MDGPIVRVEEVRKTFGGRVRALDGVSLAFEPGIIYGLLGPNGAGKTTLIRVLATLLEPDSGSAWVAGIDVVRDPVGVRRRIGLAGQSAAVDEFLTGRENVEMVGLLYSLAGAEARRRAGEVLEAIGLSDAADRQVRTYSGGMRRRLDLAASLVGRPQVLFLDEPTTGIDPRSRLDVWEIIRDLVGAGTTVLLTTQYLEEADQLADRIAVVDRGMVVANDTATALKARLGSTTIELGMENEDVGIRAERIISDLFSDHTERDGGTVRLTSGQGPLVLIDVLRSLEKEGLNPVSLSVREPTLDEVFLALTGEQCHASDLVHGEVICDGE